jgi:hypothetical protein
MENTNIKDIEERFDILFNKIGKRVTVEQRHHNGTGYFNGLAEEDFEDLTPFKFVDRGRRGIVIPIKSFGNVIPNKVYFERYTNETWPVVAQHMSYQDERSKALELQDILYLFRKMEFENQFKA